MIAMKNVVRGLALALIMTVAVDAAETAPAVNPASVPGSSEAAPPYGVPVTLAQAEKALAAARAEAARLGSSINSIAVVDTHGELVAFVRMDDSTIHSIARAAPPPRRRPR
jgi:glc operon protein GlcG